MTADRATGPPSQPQAMTVGNTSLGRGLPVPPLSSGRDWATWLRQAHPVSTAGWLPVPRGQVPARAWNALVHLARRNGFAADRGDFGEVEAITTWRDRLIRVHSQATPAQAVTALAHQLGHIILHGETARLDAGGTVPCQGTRRVEADSVAYLVATHLGISTAHIAFPNVSSWAGTDPRARPEATIQAVSDRVLSAAARITGHLDAIHGVNRVPAARAVTADATVRQLVLPPSAPRSDLVRIQDAAARFFRNQLPGSWVPGYLNGRGFGPAIQSSWQAGYAPAEWDALTRHLRTAGYPDTLIETAGLARPSQRGTLIDTFRDRAMLPIHSGDGTIVAFIGRARDQAPPGVPKYLNTPRTDLYNKSSVLFGLWQGCAALTQGAHPVIAEGPVDAIAITTVYPGRYVGLAPCGTALTSRQVVALDEVADLRGSGVLVAFDSDEAGQRAAVKAFRVLSPFTDRAEAVIFPAGQDPAQILNERGRIVLVEMLAGRSRPLADLVIEAEVAKWDRWLVYAGGQINALRAAAPIIAALPHSQVSRQVARLAQRLDLDHATVTEAVTDALTELVASGRARADREDTPPGRNPGRPGPPAALHASRDFPHTPQQVTAQPPPTTAPPGRNGRAAGERAPLRTRRVPG
jgi:DNA primase